MDADGSGAIGSDELNNAFKVRTTQSHPSWTAKRSVFILRRDAQSFMLSLTLALCLPAISLAIHLDRVHMHPNTAAAGNQGKEVNNRQDDS